MPFLQRDEEVRLFYETWGEGDRWITLVNGYTRPLTDYKAMGRYLSERGWRVLAFDNRGTGKTDYPPVFTITDIGEDILALWTHLGCTASHLLGISYGGAIAATLAATHPAPLKSLALVSTPFSEGFLAAEKAGPVRDPRKFALLMTRYFSPEFVAKNQMLVQGFIRQVAKTFQEPESALGARAQRESMEELDLSLALSEIRVPTLVIHGEMDRIVGVDSGRKIAGTVPNAQLEILPGIGHLMLAESPTKLYETAENFFRAQNFRPE